jgi:hypothetical protein
MNAHALYASGFILKLSAMFVRFTTYMQLLTSLDCRTVDGVHTFRRGESFEDEALLGFTLPVDELFDAAPWLIRQ